MSERLIARILAAIDDDDPWTAADVAEVIGISPEAVAPVLRRLAEEGKLRAALHDGRQTWSRH